MKNSKRRRKTVRLSKRLLVSYLLVCLVPLFLTVFLVSLHSMEMLKTNTQQQAALFSTQIVHNIDSFTESYSQLTRLLTMDYAVIAELNEAPDGIYEQMNRNTTVRRLLMRIAMLRPDIQNVMLMTRNGTLYQYSSLGLTVDAQALTAQPWYTEALASPGNLSITPTHMTEYYEGGSGSIAVSVVRRLYANNGSEVGLLLVDINPYALIELTETMQLEGMEDQIRIIVRTAEGGFVYDSRVSDGTATWEQLLAEPQEDAWGPQDFVWKQQTEEGLLEVTIVIPQQGMLAEMYTFGVYVTILMSLSVLAVFLISARESGRITRPIRSLQERMSLAESGDYSLLPVPEKRDEVGSLIEHYNHMIQTIRALINEVYLGQIKQKEATLLALRTQINPHVLFNTLEAIRMKAVVNGDTETAGMIKRLSRMFRDTLDAGESPHTVRAEIDYAQNYIELQNIRFRDRFHLTCRVPQALMEMEMPPVVFQPIIENSIEHGGRASHAPMQLTVEAAVQDGQLMLTFTDDGAGMTPEAMAQLNRKLAQISAGELEPVSGGEKIALRNIAERIYLRYGAGYGLQVQYSGPEGTMVALRLPAAPHSPAQEENDRER